MKQLVELQFMYMARPHSKVREAFLHALCKNITDMVKESGFSDELEIAFLALAIKAFGSKLSERKELCWRALDALDVLFSSS